MDRHLGGDRDRQHQPGEQNARQGAITGFEKFGGGEPPIANAEREQEQEQRGKAKAPAGRKFDSPSGKSVPVAITREPHKVLGPDIGGKQRRTDEWPGKTAIRQKEAGLSAEDFLRTVGQKRMLELKTTRQIAQSIKPREKDICPSLDIRVAGEWRAFPAHAILHECESGHSSENAVTFTAR